MAKVKAPNTSKPKVNMRPAITPEAEESQMVSLAMDLVRQRLIDGTASSQETTHFLKQASNKTRLENQILELQKELIAAKTEAIRSEKHREELFTEAIAAMKRYGGHRDEFEDEDY
jgi:hypothetical protein